MKLTRSLVFATKSSARLGHVAGDWHSPLNLPNGPTSNWIELRQWTALCIGNCTQTSWKLTGWVPGLRHGGSLAFGTTYRRSWRLWWLQVLMLLCYICFDTDSTLVAILFSSYRIFCVRRFCSDIGVPIADSIWLGIPSVTPSCRGCIDSINHFHSTVHTYKNSNEGLMSQLYQASPKIDLSSWGIYETDILVTYGQPVGTFYWSATKSIGPTCVGVTTQYTKDISTYRQPYSWMRRQTNIVWYRFFIRVFAASKPFAKCVDPPGESIVPPAE